MYAPIQRKCGHEAYTTRAGNCAECLEAEVKALTQKLDNVTQELASVVDGYTTCEQCDGPTETVQFCAKCWNALARRAEASDLQNQAMRELLFQFAANVHLRQEHKGNLDECQEPPCAKASKYIEKQECRCGCHVGGEGATTACGCCTYPTGGQRT